MSLATATPTLAHNPVLIGIELFAASVWVGSLVCLVVVTSSARATLAPPERVAFFRALGRRYGIVGSSALLVALGVGLAMAWPPSTWGALIDTAVALAGALVVASVLGMRQARAMTRRRRAQASQEAPAGPVRGSRAALALRAAIAGTSLAIVAVTARLLGS